MSEGGSWTPAEVPDLDGRTIVVTGANSGIGLEATREFVENGAHVVMACRSIERGERAAAEVDGRGSTEVLELDLASLDSVRAFAETFEAAHKELHVLVTQRRGDVRPVRLHRGELRAAVRRESPRALRADGAVARPPRVDVGRPAGGDGLQRLPPSQRPHGVRDGPQPADLRQGRRLLRQQTGERAVRPGTPAPVAGGRPRREKRRLSPGVGGDEPAVPRPKRGGLPAEATRHASRQPRVRPERNTGRVADGVRRHQSRGPRRRVRRAGRLHEHARDTGDPDGE